MNRPNVVFITCHDLGDYLGCYGTPLTTPNLDELADQGVLFENHFSTGTVCSPSRGSIITGCYPHTNGLMGLVHRGWALDVDRCSPLAALLGRAGYETHLFGFQHEHWEPRRLGYDHVHKGKSLFCEDVASVFQQWLAGRKLQGRPFLAAIGFSETHRLGMDPSHFKRDLYEPADPSHVEVRPYLPDIPQVREDLADFYGMVEFMDKTVGRMLDALTEAGLADDTLVIFTSDHGASFMHSKATLYDGGTKVALIARCPGVLPRGVRCKALTSHVDVVPTILDLLDLPVPEQVEGESLASIREGTISTERQYVYAEKNYTNYYDPARMIRSGSFKYIRKGLRTCIFDFIIPELELCSSGFRRNRSVFEFYPIRRCREELYDLASDPGEMNNVADDPKYGRTMAELRAALDEHLEATGDPFKDLRNDLLMPEDVYAAVRASNH